MAELKTNNYIRVFLDKHVNELVFFDDTDEEATLFAVARAHSIRQEHTQCRGRVVPRLVLWRPVAAIRHVWVICDDAPAQEAA